MQKLGESQSAMKMMLDKDEPMSQKVCNFILSVAINGYLMYLFYKYWKMNPDPEQCWVAGNGAYATETEAMDANQSLRPENMAETFRMWFQFGFILQTAGLIGTILQSAGKCCKNICIIGLGTGVACLGCLPGLVWMIYGCIWRWGENGTIAACYTEDCQNMVDTEGMPQIYQIEGGSFMNIWCIVMVVIWSMTIPCLVCMCCCATAIMAKMAGSAN